MRLEWDVYEGSAPRRSSRWAASDRGWCRWANHPDAAEHGPQWWVGSPMVGNYLDYGLTHEPVHAGGQVHAMAYVIQVDPVAYQERTRYLGTAWCRTPEAARAWIEATVRDALDPQGVLLGVVA